MKRLPGSLLAALACTSVMSASSVIAPNQVLTSGTNGLQTFGESVAINGRTMVIGAPTTGNFLTGAAYIFAKEGTKWNLQQRLLPPEPLPTFGYFGRSVAVSGSTVVIGTGSEGSDASHVYVYRPGTNDWILEQIIPARGQVAIDGDTLVVTDYGATVQRGAAEFGEAGDAEVFVRSNGVWSFQQRLTAGDPIDSGYFGRGVAIDGDTLVIGAIGDLETSDESGAAYVFTRVDGWWGQTQKLRASNPQRAGDFGRALDLKGDLLGIGAPGYVDWTDQYPKAGYAYVFRRSGNTWVEQQRLAPSGTKARDGFGYAVAVTEHQIIVNDFDQSPVSYEDLRSGAAHIFREHGGAWIEQGKVGSAAGDMTDLFGMVAAADGDSVVVGDPTIFGSAYVYERLVLSQLRRDGSGLKLSFGSDAGRTYTLKTASSLQAPNAWETLATLTGNGSVMEIPVTAAGNQRFYHVILEP